MFDLEAKRKRAAGEEGFTLIELLVVIIILGILAAVVVFAVGGVGDKGQNAACQIDTRTLRTAQEAYAAQTVANGGGGGNYGEEAQLVPGFLSEQSKLHDITLAADKKSFTIIVKDVGCGTLNAPVNGTTNV